MKCVICRNGETTPGLADKTLSFDGMTLVVKDVPAEICENCGERYFDADVTGELLKLARDQPQLKASSSTFVGTSRPETAATSSSLAEI